jgi:pimeloyl-ACP methyl ester carboxylesterase
MKHALNRDQRIAYDVFGGGSRAVVLQHGLGGTRQVWRAFGYVEALFDRFTVITIDSLGHGDSDKPADAAPYARRQRAEDIAAVLDAEGIARAHYVGYSMGGWLGVGLLAHRPERLLSLTIGNFDPTPGEAPRPLPTIEQFLAAARAAVPGAVDWVTPEAVPGLGHCLAAVLTERLPLETVTGSPVPIQFWTGSDDPSRAGLTRLHEAMPGSVLNVVPGDHIATMRGSSRESAAAIRNFLMGV